MFLGQFLIFQPLMLLKGFVSCNNLNLFEQLYNLTFNYFLCQSGQGERTTWGFVQVGQDFVNFNN